GQPRPAVDLHRARPALAGLAVPPDGQVAGLSGLQPVQDVEHNPALVDLPRLVGELAGTRVSAPDPQRSLVTHYFFSSAGEPAVVVAAVSAPSAVSGGGSAGLPATTSTASSSSVMYFFSSPMSNSSSRSVRIGIIA